MHVVHVLGEWLVTLAIMSGLLIFVVVALAHLLGRMSWTNIDKGGENWDGPNKDLQVGPGTTTVTDTTIRKLIPTADEVSDLETKKDVGKADKPWSFGG